MDGSNTTQIVLAYIRTYRSYLDTYTYQLNFDLRKLQTGTSSPSNLG